MFLLALLGFRSIDTAEFDELITNGNGTIPYFLMFLGRHCPACHATLPAFCEAEDRVYDMTEFLTLDTKKNQEIAMRYEIMSIPFFGFFFAGKAFPFTGRRNAPAFTSFIAESVAYRIPLVNDTWLKHEYDQVILFTKRRSPPTILAAGYGMFARYGIQFGICTDDEMAEKMTGEATFTSIWFIRKGDTERKMFHNFNHVPEFQSAISEFFDVPLIRREPHGENNKCEMPELDGDDEEYDVHDHEHHDHDDCDDDQHHHAHDVTAEL